jgi:hypothetical protein
MKNCAVSFFSILILAAVITLACGSPQKIMTGCSSFAGSNTTGSLESVAVCPAVADAQQYPGGQVPFVAVGAYTTQPSPAVIPTGVTWGACQGEANTNDVTFVSGVAKCASGASGTYNVYAIGGYTECEHIGPCGTGCVISGTAQLTCP